MAVLAQTVTHTVKEVQVDEEFIMAIFWNNVEDQRSEEELAHRHDNIKRTTARVDRMNIRKLLPRNHTSSHWMEIVVENYTAESVPLMFPVRRLK